MRRSYVEPKPFLARERAIRWFLCMLCLCGILGRVSRARAGQPLPKFERIVIDANFPGGYQVEVADVNGDGRPDVIGLGAGTCAWFENPSWTKHVVTSPRQTPGIISSATADLDGDGKAEIAIGYEFGLDRPAKGQLLLASQVGDGKGGWTLRHVDDVGSIHRLRWGDVDGDKRLDLVVAPIVGLSAKPPAYSQGRAEVRVYLGANRPKNGDATWANERAGGGPVLHGIKVLDFDGDGRDEVLLASNDGITLCDRDPNTGRWATSILAPGAPGQAPKRGSSEIQVGRLAKGGRFLASIDPWHGTEVAVYLEAPTGSFGPRSVLDSTLKDGHALWVADVDGDGDDEVFAGYRGAGTSVLAFDFDGKTWTRTVLDPALAAQDLRGGDLDGNGTPDFVAIGGQTHNIVWFRPVQ